MKKLCLVIIAIVVSGFFLLSSAVSISAGDSKLPLKRLMVGADGGHDLFVSKPASEIMSPEIFTQYSNRLTALDCDRANELLIDAFFQAYPQFSKIQEKFSIVNNPGCSGECPIWVMFVAGNFEGLSICIVERKFVDSQKILDGRPGVASKYPQTFKSLEEANERPIVDDRDASLYNMSLFSDQGKLAATLKIIELIRRGDIFSSAGPEVEYFALLRACHQGADCRKFEPRLGELKSIIGEERAEKLRAHASWDHSDRLRLHDLLRGEAITFEKMPRPGR